MRPSDHEMRSREEMEKGALLVLKVGESNEVDTEGTYAANMPLLIEALLDCRDFLAEIALGISELREYAAAKHEEGVTKHDQAD